MTIWSIANLERNTSDGGVVVAHWRATLTSGDHTASNYGTAGFTPDASAEGFVAFASLDEATVITWVKAQLDADAIETGLQAQIDALENPTTLTGVAW